MQLIPHRRELTSSKKKSDEETRPSESRAQMDLVNWLSNHFSDRGRALSLYKRGMAKAKKGDHHGAIDDYTATMGLSYTPVDVKAMALYHRAVAHVATGDFEKGVEDLDAIMKMDGAPISVKIRARKKHARRAAGTSQSNR